MKRFLLFGGEAYYANGGWQDFLSAFDSLDEASHAGRELLDRIYTREKDDGSPWELQLPVEWWHVVDTDTQTIVAGSMYQGYGGDPLPFGEKQ